VRLTLTLNTLIALRCATRALRCSLRVAVVVRDRRGDDGEGATFGVTCYGESAPAACVTHTLSLRLGGRACGSSLRHGRRRRIEPFVLVQFRRTAGAAAVAATTTAAAAECVRQSHCVTHTLRSARQP